MKKSDIQIYDVEAFSTKNDTYPHGVVVVNWDSNIGFGEWKMYFDEKGIPHIYTECMDDEHDKSFSKKILQALLDISIIEE